MPTQRKNIDTLVRRFLNPERNPEGDPNGCAWIKWRIKQRFDSDEWYVREPRAELQISDCFRHINLEFPIATATEKEESVAKLGGLVKDLQDMHRLMKKTQPIELPRSHFDDDDYDDDDDGDW